MSRRQRVAAGADVGALALVAAGLVAVHVLVPPDLQGRLAFEGGLERPHTLVTSAYVHASDSHLLGNLVGYAAGAGYAYVVCAGVDETRWFRLTSLALLSVLPVLVNLGSRALLEVTYGGALPPSRGFSGVTAGFAGLLFVAVLVLVRTVYGRVAARTTGLVLLAALAGEILLIYAETTPVLWGGLVVALVGLAALGLGRRTDFARPATREGWATLLAVGLQVALGGVTLGFLVVGLFPADVVVEGTFRNVFAHASGLVFGGVIAGWGYRYWGREPRLL